MRTLQSANTNITSIVKSHTCNYLVDVYTCSLKNYVQLIILFKSLKSWWYQPPSIWPFVENADL